EALIGTDAMTELLAREIKSFPGRLGIQNRDVPYALLSDVADGGLIFDHLAAFYAQRFPDRLRRITVPAAEPFGQEIAVARTMCAQTPLAAAFGRFFLEAARTAYPNGGFADTEHFRYGATLGLIKP